MGQKLRKILFKITDILGDSRLLSFIFPFLTVILAFAILQVYPVGDRTVLTVDLYHQYMPFIYELNHPDDPLKGAGIRIVVGMAKEVRYMPAMGLNNLLIIL